MSISQMFLDDPPAYVEEETIEKPPVEVGGPSSNSVFEPVERQRHFGILTYTMNDRFKKMTILLVIVIFLLTAIVITLMIVLLHLGSSEGTATTSKTAFYSTPTFTTTKLPTTTTTRTWNFEKTSTSPVKTTVMSSPSIRTTYSPEPDDISCDAGSKSSTFLFAYSNDLLSKTVLDTWNTFVNHGGYPYSWFGSVRFDTPNMDVKIHFNMNGVNSTIYNNLPDPNQGFQNPSIGSNIFDVLEKFFAGTQAPVCESIILILLKRYPNEADNSRLVSKIRSHHSIVHVITSSTPSGGSQPKTMYSVASKTNGMGAFENDDSFSWAMTWFPISGALYPVYATTVPVFEKGTKTLPDFNSPKSENYWISITYQDHVPIDSFQNLNLRCYQDSPNFNYQDSRNFSVYESDISAWHGGTLAGGWASFYGINYKISLDYIYSGQSVQNLQIRIYSKTINVIVKRLPTTEVDVKSIIAKLKKFHVGVYFAILENTIGGNNLDALNEIAFRTNGLSMIFKDERIDLGVFKTQYFDKRTLIYAANFNVSGQGTIELPPMTVPNDGMYKFLMSFKDDPVSDAYQSATITCTHTEIDHTFVYTFNTEFTEEWYVNFVEQYHTFDKGTYTVKLEYEYANQDVERLFIRVSNYVSAPPVDYWVPYDN